MKLYEVNQQIEDLILQLEPDPETGEIPANEDEIIAQINELALKKEDILQYLAKLALNTKATVQSMKAEEKRLHDRRQRMEQRQDRLIAVLDRNAAGRRPTWAWQPCATGKAAGWNLRMRMPPMNG